MHDAFDGVLNEHYRQLRQLWNQDFIEQLRKLGILPGASGVGTGSLPANTMINRGTYSATATYRPGDLVVAAGTAYVAILGSTGVAVSDLTTWQPLGGTTIPPPPDTFVYLTDGDGAYLTDADGAYLWEPA